MKNFLAKSFSASFIIAILLHFLLFAGFLLIKLPLVKSKPPPSKYVSSYLYHDRAQPAPAAPKQAQEKPTTSNKNAVASSRAPESYRDANDPVRFASHPQVINVSKIVDEEPIHLVGESKIVQPLVKLLGKALTAKLFYPKIAVDFNVKGTVFVGFVLHPDGSLTDIKLVHTSNAGVLDNAALTAVAAMSPVKNVDLYLKKQEFLVIAIIFG